MKNKIILLLVLLSSITANTQAQCNGVAQTAFMQFLGGILKVNVTTGEAYDTINTGLRTTGLKEHNAVSHDGNFSYFVSYNSASPSSDSIYVTNNFTKTTSLFYGFDPNIYGSIGQIVLSPDDQKLYVSFSINFTCRIISINTATKLINSIHVDPYDNCNKFALSPDGNKLCYLSTDDSLTVLNPNTLYPELLYRVYIPVNRFAFIPHEMKYSIDGSKLYIGLDDSVYYENNMNTAIYINYTGAILILNTVNYQLQGRVDHLGSVNDICLSPDGTRAYIQSLNVNNGSIDGAQIMYVNTLNNSIIDSVDIGDFALSNLSINADGNKLLLTNWGTMHNGYPLYAGNIIDLPTKTQTVLLPGFGYYYNSSLAAVTFGSDIIRTTPCTVPTIPTLGSNVANNIYAQGTDSATLSVVSGSLGSATRWQWYTGSCGGTLIGTGTSIKVAPSVSTTYYVRGEGGCVLPCNCGSITILAGPVPAKPASVTQTLVSNTCGARVFRYTSSAVTNATGYSWTLPTSLGGFSGVTLDSGNASSSRIIKVKYAPNVAALTTDSIWVKAYNSNGYSSKLAAKLSIVSSIPATPASITITKIDQLACGKPRYRYTAPALLAATSTTVAATGYDWSFTGTLGATAVVDSGSLTSRIFTVYFNSPNAVAASGDSVKVRYNSSCEYSPYKASKLTNTLTGTTVPVAPASITQTLVSDACGARIYRYTALALPAGTTTYAAATGYTWSLPTGPMGSTGVLDSGSLSCASCRIIRVKYSSNAGSGTGDSIRLSYNSLCGNSAVKAFKLTLPVTPPVAPASLTQTLVSNVCGARVYRYSTTALPAGTAAIGYNWVFKGTLFGTLGVNSFIDSGSLSSQTLLVRYTSNAAAATGDSAKVQYNSACGYGAFKAAKLTNTVLACVTSGNPIVTKTNGISNQQTKSDISVYPNPSHHLFTLKFNDDDQYTIMVNDISGRKRKIYNNVSGQFELGDDLPAGTYLLKIYNDRKAFVRKVVKL